MRPVAEFRIRERLCVTGGGTAQAEEEEEEEEEEGVVLVSGGGEGMTAPRVTCGAVVVGVEAETPAAVAAAAAEGVRTRDMFLPPPLPPGPAHDVVEGGKEIRGG